MKYTSEAQEAFFGGENYGKSLELLEQAYKATGVDIEFVCSLDKDGGKIVGIFREGFLQRMERIEIETPFSALKKIAAAVR